MKMKKFFQIFVSMILFAVAVVTGGGVMAAAAVALDGGGTGKEGESSYTNNEEIADEEYYQKDIDERVVKVRPLQTPVDTIARKAGVNSKCDSPIVKYYKVGTRAVSATVDSSGYTAAATATAVINTDNNGAFSQNDLLQFKGIDGYKEDGTSKSGQDFVGYVVAQTDDGKLRIAPVNGVKNGSIANTVPAIAASTVVIRIGSSAGELDAQAPAYTTVPEASIQFCQNYMMQIEQSTIEKLWKKEVNYNFNDLEEDAIFRMKLGIEMSALFGAKREFVHPQTNNKVWTQEGIWYQAGKEFQHTGTAWTESDLIDLHKTIFTGSAGGSKRKLIIGGSGLISALSKATSEKVRLEKNDKFWDLQLNGYTTAFGTSYILLHEVFDMEGMENNGLVIDPEYLTKRTYIPFGRSVLDLKKAGIRNTNAIVLQEMSCIYLRYPTAHCRIVAK